jgi:alpha-1,2-mannosyltransferase
MMMSPKARVIATVSVVATAVVLALAALAMYSHDAYWGARWMVDLTVYHAVGHAFVVHQPLYDVVINSPLYGPMPYLYPPLTAGLLLAPLSFLPMNAASLVWNIASLMALGGAVWITTGIARLTDWRTRTVVTVVALVLLWFTLPVRVHLIAGQVNALLLLLVMLDFRRGAGRWRGVGIGIAAGLKVTPLIFVAYLLITKQWKAARTAVLTFLGTVVVDLVIAPHDTIEYWGGLVLQSSRAGGVYDTPNQSLSGSLARVFSDTAIAPWFFAVLAGVLVLGLVVARYAHRRGSDFLGYSATAITGLLISPVSWEHHWVYALPLGVWLGITAWRERSVLLGAVTAVLYAVFTVRLFTILGIPEAPPEPLHLAAWQMYVTTMFVSTGLLLLLLAPLWLRRRVEPEPDVAPPRLAPTVAPAPTA